MASMSNDFTETFRFAAFLGKKRAARSLSLPSERHTEHTSKKPTWSAMSKIAWRNKDATSRDNDVLTGHGNNLSTFN